MASWVKIQEMKMKLAFFFNTVDRRGLYCSQIAPFVHYVDLMPLWSVRSSSVFVELSLIITMPFSSSVFFS